VMFPRVQERLQRARLRCILLRGMRFAAMQRLAGLDSAPRKMRKTGFSMRLHDGSDMLQADAVDINHDVKEIVMQQQLARIHLSQDALNTKLDNLVASVQMLGSQPMNHTSTWTLPIGHGVRRRAVAEVAAGAASRIQDKFHGFREKAAASSVHLVRATTNSGSGLAQATTNAASSGRASVSAFAHATSRRFSLSPSRSKSLEVGPLYRFSEKAMAPLRQFSEKARAR